MKTIKKEEPRQSTPQIRIGSIHEYTYLDENGNTCQELRIHKAFKELIHPLSREERFDLERSLEDIGCTDPIKVWNGYIIDGHNRYEICKSKDIAFHVLEMAFKDNWEAKRWMIDNQLGRRNLTDAARIEYASLRLAIVRGLAQKNQEASQFQKNSFEGLSPKTKRTFERRDEKRRAIVSRAIASNAGVGSRTVEKYNYLKNHADPETLQNLREGKLVCFGKKNKKRKLSIDGLYRELKNKERKPYVQKSFTVTADLRSKEENSKNIYGELHNGERLKNNLKNIREQEDKGFRPIKEIINEMEEEMKTPKKLIKRVVTHKIDELYRYVEKGSVDVILTKPPCKEEDIDLFYNLGEFARHALKQGGLCIAIAGNEFLPDFIEMLRAHLDYMWTASLDTVDSHYEAPCGHIIEQWKPVLIYSNGEANMERFSDVKESLESLMHTFTRPGQVICDPFCKNGEITKLLAKHGRSVIASDCDKDKTEALKEVLL